jgi:hypothetical protein
VHNAQFLPAIERSENHNLTAAKIAYAVNKKSAPDLLVNPPNLRLIKLCRSMDRKTEGKSAHFRSDQRNGTTGISEMIVQVRQGVPFHQARDYCRFGKIRDLSRDSPSARRADFQRQRQCREISDWRQE